MILKSIRNQKKSKDNYNNIFIRILRKILVPPTKRQLISMQTVFKINQK